MKFFSDENWKPKRPALCPNSKIPRVNDQDPDDAYTAEVVETAFEKTRQFIEELAANGDLILRKEC